MPTAIMRFVQVLLVNTIEQSTDSSVYTCIGFTARKARHVQYNYIAWG